MIFSKCNMVNNELLHVCVSSTGEGGVLFLSAREGRMTLPPVLAMGSLLRLGDLSHLSSRGLARGTRPVL